MICCITRSFLGEQFFIAPTMADLFVFTSLVVSHEVDMQRICMNRNRSVYI